MSDCNVCLGDWVEDGPVDFQDVRIVCAKKEHICGECRLPIVAGQKYERVAVKYDGEFEMCKTCLICCELRTAFSCDPDKAITYGELWHEIRTVLFPQMTTGCLQNIRTVEAKSFLIRRWEEWKFKPVQSAGQRKGE